MVDIRVGIRNLEAWLHNARAHSADGHGERFNAAKKRLSKLAEIAENRPKERVFPAQFAYLRKVEPMVFEEMVIQAFANGGFTRKANRQYTGDGGIDGRVWVDDWATVDPYFARRRHTEPVGGWCGIQCKRYEGPIHREHIRQFPVDLQRAGLVAGFFVHTGTTPKPRKTANTPVSAWMKEPDGFAPGTGSAPGTGFAPGTGSRALPPVRLISGRHLLAFLQGGEWIHGE